MRQVSRPDVPDVLLSLITATMVRVRRSGLAVARAPSRTVYMEVDEMEHGSDKTGPIRDDEAKKQMQGELKANRALRTDEEHEPEPSGEDQPSMERSPNAPLPASAPSGMSPEDVEIRSEIARHLGRSLYPADKEAIRRTLKENNAPQRLVELAGKLPEGRRFANAQEIVEALGIGTENPTS